ncbi:hypothetical protein BE17_36595 [Sorangium cellulosum]|uniref:Uncharacterized protein n=1 Tax=Sorangium cellulosum TaxID=56 RepID=A0A150S5H0_SORCE|nr:hypothetical protein BE17_36595 [Sorangium cellulosum]
MVERARIRSAPIRPCDPSRAAEQSVPSLLVQRSVSLIMLRRHSPCLAGADVAALPSSGAVLP